MNKENFSTMCRAAILVACAMAGVSAVHAQTTRLPNAQLPLMGSWPTDGNDASTQWRIPDNAVTPAKLAVQSAVEQTLNAWSQARDSQDPAAVANLFVPNGSFSLYYINQTTTPWTQVPTGYSPSATPTGGTAGGGCTAVGRTALANYMRGAGLSAGYAWPVPAASRTLLMDAFVKVDPNDPTVATAHAYFVSGVWGAAGNSAQQLFGTFKYDGTAWKISDLRLLYTTAQPSFPCQN